MMSNLWEKNVCHFSYTFPLVFDTKNKTKKEKENIEEQKVNAEIDIKQR